MATKFFKNLATNTDVLLSKQGGKNDETIHGVTYDLDMSADL